MNILNKTNKLSIKTNSENRAVTFLNRKIFNKAFSIRAAVGELTTVNLTENSTLHNFRHVPNPPKLKTHLNQYSPSKTAFIHLNSRSLLCNSIKIAYSYPLTVYGLKKLNLTNPLSNEAMPSAGAAGLPPGGPVAPPEGTPFVTRIL